jgi:hypothetical protein
MNRKVMLGNDYAYQVNNEIKSKVIDYLYSKLDLSKYRYIILNTITKLQFLKENEHYVSHNFKGLNYFLILVTINNIKYSVIIDRKKLSYHKQQLDIKHVEVLEIKLNISDCLFDGTIFDGKIINTNNNYIFLIQDCLYMMGNSLKDMKMNNKINYLDSIIKLHFKKNTITDDKNLIENKNLCCLNFYFKLNKLYNYGNLKDLIQNLDKINSENSNIISGIIFYPKLSGINVIHIEKKVEKYEQNNIIENKSYNIIHNYVDFLKSRTYSYEQNHKKKILWLNKSIVPDVYDISETENSEKMGIALIPNLKISHLCDNLIQEKPLSFECIYCTKFKKWIPISPVIK